MATRGGRILRRECLYLCSEIMAEERRLERVIASGGGDLDAEKLGRGFITELRRGPDEHSETPATDLPAMGRRRPG